jgi:TonB-linked SusC/RagA family outer membrane protein
MNVRRLIAGLLLGCTASLSVYGQDRIRVEGQVSDESGEPVIGATVIVKGTTQGTVTGIDGDFTLTVPQGSVLQVSGIGYETALVDALRAGKLEITLREQTVEVEEVVVVAYGTARKSTFTGSALAVGSEQIARTPASNPAAALQGLSAGVSVINNMGDPAADPLITIRGVGSIRAATAPLYVVDGVPYDGSLNAIAPADVESMTVLKDAAASSLYGSRAANGVVMITTKKAKQKKASVSLNSSWGYSELAVPFPEIMDPGTFYEYQWEGFYNDRFYVAGDDDATARQYATDRVIPYLIAVHQNSKGENVYVHPYDTDTPVGLDGKLKPDAKLIWDPADYDWPGAYLKKNLRQEYSANVSGMANGEDLNYMFSASYLDDKGFTIGQLFNRYTFRSSVTNRINDHVTAGLNMAYTHSRQNNGNNATRFLRNMQTYVSPWLRNTDNTDWIYNERTGERMLDFGYYRKEWGGSNNFANALATDTDNDGSWSFDVTYRDVISARSFLEIDILKGLRFRTNLSLDNTNRKTNRYGSAIHGSAQSDANGWGLTVLSSGGTSYKTATRQTSTTWNNLLTYETEIHKVHHLNLLLGHELYARNYEYFYGYRNGIMLPNLYELDNASGSSYDLESYKDTYRLLSFFGRAEYDYADKYYLSASYRQDGSSRFSKDFRWGGFFSAGASWRLSQEAFIHDIEWINNLSLRASFGTTGNDNLLNSNDRQNYYAYQGTFEAYNLYGNAGVRLNTAATPDLIWEKNRQFNVGVDFRLFGALSGSAEYFDRSSEDLLYYRDLPLSGVAGAATGYNTNMGNVANRGLELSLNWTPLRGKQFSWNIDANVTILKNEVTSLPDGDYTFTGGGGNSYYLMHEGGSRYDLLAPRYAGVDPQTGNALYWKKIFDAEGRETGREKTPNYAEVSSTSQMDVIGSTIPKVYGSLTNSFRYRDFDFSFMLYYSLGSLMYDHMYIESQTMRLGFSLVEDFVKDRWQKPGDQTDYPRLTVTDYSLTRKYTDRFIFKNDYLRLRNMSLGYSLPKNLLKKAGVANARFFVTGINLLTWGAGAKRGTDPEIQANGSAYNGANAEGALGASKSVSGGVQLTF